jgi:hypothetical protein
MLDISGKSQHHVNNNRRAHSEHGSINKILPDAGWGNIQFFTNGRTDSKGIPLKKTSKAIHCKRFYTIVKQNYRNVVVFVQFATLKKSEIVYIRHSCVIINKKKIAHGV